MVTCLNGVYSAARNQSRLLAVMGALLLVANFTVTAAMSEWAAMSYFGVPKEYICPATLAIVLLIGAITVNLGACSLNRNLNLKWFERGVMAFTFLELTAMLGIDMLILGATHRRMLVGILKGDVVTEVARHLPENIQLLIHG